MLFEVDEKLTIDLSKVVAVSSKTKTLFLTNYEYTIYKIKFQGAKSLVVDKWQGELILKAWKSIHKKYDESTNIVP